MTRMSFEMVDLLVRRVDEIMVQKGFGCRAEFFRYLVIEFLEKYDNKASILPPTPSPEQVAAECALSSKEKQIAEAKKKLHGIMDTQGAEYGVPAEAVEQIEKIAKLMSET